MENKNTILYFAQKKIILKLNFKFWWIINTWHKNQKKPFFFKPSGSFCFGNRYWYNPQSQSQLLFCTKDHCVYRRITTTPQRRRQINNIILQILWLYKKVWKNSHKNIIYVVITRSMCLYCVYRLITTMATTDSFKHNTTTYFVVV